LVKGRGFYFEGIIFVLYSYLELMWLNCLLSGEPHSHSLEKEVECDVAKSGTLVSDSKLQIIQVFFLNIF